MLDEALANIRIILVEPAGELNVGSVARIMKNMGLRQLVIVNPQCDPRSEDAKKMAVHAADLLESATQTATLPEALSGCQRAIATTARERSLDRRLEHPHNALGWLLEAPGALIFGPEDRGLSNEELKYAQRFVRIPSSSTYPSLNLAQAVAVCCYELSQLANPIPNLSRSNLSSSEVSQGGSVPVGSTSLAPLERLEGFYEHLETLLLNIGYLYPHTAASRMEKFRRLFNRANLSQTEVDMLRGILSQMEWALNSSQQSGTVDDTLIASSDAVADRPCDPQSNALREGSPSVEQPAKTLESESSNESSM
ncbi:RNA methyltransferase [Capilliphycus salinus ALCB114379]|uniref:RNA methyltransferase n=1 Tax=Capilliphycus salinus TaxID=2768948 RepID=UPI0039A62168